MAKMTRTSTLMDELEGIRDAVVEKLRKDLELRTALVKHLEHQCRLHFRAAQRAERRSSYFRDLLRANSGRDSTPTGRFKSEPEIQNIPLPKQEAA